MRPGVWKGFVTRFSLAVIVIPTMALVMLGLGHVLLGLLSIDPQAPLVGSAERIGAVFLATIGGTIGMVVGVAAWLVLFRLACGYERTSTVIHEGFGEGRAAKAARQVLRVVFGT